MMGTPTYKPIVGSLMGMLLVFGIAVSVSAQDTDPDALLKLSLTELMNIEIEVAGTITEKNPLKIPASMTTITAEDIALTPARNLLDLMEIYVPGALYVEHSTGPEPGIRGIIADRPYKFLVNVNGINVNIKAHYGARLELLNWDLDDIERIEIIRGAGSVTYGPGAIGGVINIYTKTPSENSTAFNVKYWDEYNSLGSNLSFSRASDKVELYGFVSVVGTEGTPGDVYGVGSSGSGYVGQTPGPSSNPAFHYMADYYGQPQIKAHVDMHFPNHWRFWSRFTTSNHNLTQGTATKFKFGNEWKDFRQTKYQHLQLALENKQGLSDTWSLKQLYGVSSIDVHNVEKWDSDLDNNKESLLNVYWAWAEYEAFARLMFQHEAEGFPVKTALGVEGSYDMIRPGWGGSEDNNLRLADGIMSGPTSQAYGTGTDGTKQYDETSLRYFAVGEGWETYTLSQLGELNWAMAPQDTLLVSYRVDKHEYTDFMFSPRLAWIHQFTDDYFFKLIGQRSVRMNTQEELLMNERLGKDNEPEVLTTGEAIFTAQASEHITYQTSLFYNENEVIAWDWAQARSAPIGTLKSAGLELEGRYQNQNTTIGLNHSYVKQIDWELDQNVAVSGISYSDYYLDAGSGVVITSNGNDLNNWSNHATKFYCNQRFVDGTLTLHGDLITFWGFEGAKDGLQALERAGGDSASINDIRDKGGYGINMTANLALAYKLSETANLTLYLQNIPVIGDNKRYSYSSGFKKSYPDKTSWVEQPMTFGIRYMQKF